VQQLTNALLAPGELPGSFTAQPPDESADSQEDACSPLSENPAGTSYFVQSAILQDQSTGTGVGEILYQMDDGADTTAAMSAFSAVPTTCGTFPGTIQNYPFTFTAAPLPGFPRLGNQVAAINLTAVALIRWIRLTVVTDLIQIQDNDTIISLVVGGDVTEGQVTTDGLAALETLAEAAARAAYDNLAALG
jgi:hypothetical protein